MAQPRTELKVERVRKGLSQEAAATNMGVERRVLGRAENGGSIRLDHAQKIAAFYDRPFEELFPAPVEEAA